MLNKKWKRATKLFVFFLMFLFISFVYVVQCYSQQIQPKMYKQLKYRHIGPRGGRTTAVFGIPDDPNVYYAGTASGGIWKTTDGGIRWEPIFDNYQAQSIGSLAVAASDTNIIWAGTGEAHIRGNVSIGNGIYKSMDGGKTWRHMGLEKTGRIGRIVIDRSNPLIVFAAAMGHCYGPQQERGVFRTTDGGKTWKRVLFVDENTGCSGIVMDPNNPRILFAGMWPLVIRTWGRHSGGPGGGLYMSIDGGTTWKHLTGHGLPDSPIGKVEIAVALNNSNRIYAMIETGDGILWRSDDGGENWKLVNSDHYLTQRPHYYTRCVVSPDDSNEIYALAVLISRSLDGGLIFERINNPANDHHDLWIDPTNANRMILGNDHNVAISVNRGKSWLRTSLPVAQMYHVAVDNRIPYYVYGNRQDGPSYRGPSRGGGRRRSSGTWHSVGGNEAGFAIPDPVDNNIVWSNGYDGHIDRFDLRTLQSRSVDIWPVCTVGAPAADLKYRFQWTFPVAISPHDHNKIYAGSQHVHQTTDGGHSWTVISPDLSTNDKSKQQDSGGLTVDNHQIDFCCVIFALAESPLEEGVIWAGTNDGLVHVTRDGGKNWTNVTSNIPDLPPWGTVSNIEPSKHDAGTCYITVDFHQVNNRNPYVYKTANYGKSWASISLDIPKSVFSYAHCVREDPVRKGLLYLGTENGVYFSPDDGRNWLPLQNNLPHAPAHWLVVQEHFNDLVVATYGRGFWILDDITPLQNLTADVVNSEAYLFPPRPAYRIPRGRRSGASINYYLKSVPSGDVMITIQEEKGGTIRTFQGTKEVGINRIRWDLRYEAPKKAKLWTKPPDHPHVEFGPEGWRPLVSDGFTWGGRRGPLVTPGLYTVKLSVTEQDFTQNLTVKKDPNSTPSEKDIMAQVKIAIELRDNINSVVDIINRIELIRRQIYDLIDTLEKKKEKASIIDAGKEVDKKFIELEKKLFPVHILIGSFKEASIIAAANLDAGQDAFRTPHMLWGKLCSLLGRVTRSDFPPTTQVVEVHNIHKKNLINIQAQFNELITKDLLKFNNMLKKENVPNIISGMF